MTPFKPKPQAKRARLRARCRQACSHITQRYTHDAAGNLTQKQNTANPADQTQYSWDAQNKLSQINQTGNPALGTPQLNASYTYDAFGRRIQASIQQGPASPSNPFHTVQYLYEGAQALGEIRSGQLSHRLLTGLGLDETIARIALNTTTGQKDAAGSRIYLTDALNSVIAQLGDDSASGNNTAGQLQNSYAYSPYGQSAAIGPDAANNPNQYTSRENDQTGLLFYRARYYDPVLKRFISSDPIGFAGGMNMYSYVQGDPVGYADPRGLDRIRWFSPSGPLYGNWGGKDWSGGQRPSQNRGQMGIASPVDSVDMCAQQHDMCWDNADRGTNQCETPQSNKKSKDICDAQFASCLLRLPDDPRKWPMPPTKGTEADATRFRNGGTFLGLNNFFRR